MNIQSLACIYLKNSFSRQCRKNFSAKKLSKDEQAAKLKTINQILEKENIAYDINSYRTAPAGFRIWGGATIETTDIEKLLPWIKWAYLTNLNV